MNIIVLFIGLFMLAIGLGYLYHPDKVQRFNNWVKEYIFNDRLLITHRRKVGVMLLFAGAVIVYFAIR